MAIRDESPGGAEEEGEPKEAPVHYQISITGRQAGAFFFALLVALGLSFFFGMKTGAEARRGPEPALRSAAVSESVVSPLASGERGERHPAPGSTVSGRSGMATKSAPPLKAELGEKRLGFEDAAPVVSAREPVGAESVPAATPLPTARPAPTPLPTVHETPAPTATPLKPKPAGPFYVQLLATRNEKTADELVKKLKRQGFRADVSTAPKQPELFRVRVGPYPDRPKAEAGRSKIKKVNPELKNPVVGP